MLPKENEIAEVLSLNFIYSISNAGWLLVFICAADIVLTMHYIEILMPKNKTISFIINNFGKSGIVYWKTMTSILPLLVLEKHLRGKGFWPKFALIFTVTLQCFGTFLFAIYLPLYLLKGRV